MINKYIVAVFSILLLSGAVSASNITVNMWLDREMNQRYYNEFLWIYLQNKTFQPGDITYNLTCYKGQYTGGVAYINTPNGRFDILAADGAISWSNETGCPDKVENYDIWATAQSNYAVDGDATLDYFVNTTLIAPPRQYFWNAISFRAIISVIVWIIIGILCFAMGYWTKSGLGVFIAFVILVIIKLILGI